MPRMRILSPSEQEAFDRPPLFDHRERKQLKGRGPAGKSAVVGVKDRITNRVHAQVTASTDAATLQSFIREHVRKGAEVYTDEHGGYKNLNGFNHEAVNHNDRDYDTLAITARIAAGLSGKRLRYGDLIADNGLESGAQS